MAVQDVTGRLHSTKTGRFVPKGYNDETGIWEDQQSWKTRARNVGNKVIFDSNDPNRYDPLQVLPNDVPSVVFDKIVATPLFIKNVDLGMQHIFDAGYKKINEGFGLSHYFAKNPLDPNGKKKDWGDEPYGIDYHLNLKNPITGKELHVKVDFKFIKVDKNNPYDKMTIPLKLFRDNGDAQFLNEKHENTAYMFMCLDTDEYESDENLIRAAQNGQLYDKVKSGMKVFFYSRKFLKEKMKEEFGSEDGLRKIAEEQREKLKNGLILGRDVLKYNPETGKPLIVRQDVYGRSGKKFWLITKDDPKEGLITQIRFDPENYYIKNTWKNKVDVNKINF